MASKFEEANARKFKNIFVCQECRNKIRSRSMKVKAGIIKCRNPKCKSKNLRTKRKK